MCILLPPPPTPKRVSDLHLAGSSSLLWLGLVSQGTRSNFSFSLWLLHKVPQRTSPTGPKNLPNPARMTIAPSNIVRKNTPLARNGGSEADAQILELNQQVRGGDGAVGFSEEREKDVEGCGLAEQSGELQKDPLLLLQAWPCGEGHGQLDVRIKAFPLPPPPVLLPYSNDLFAQMAALGFILLLEWQVAQLGSHPH